jgi:hypothetical protein
MNKPTDIVTTSTAPGKSTTVSAEFPRPKVNGKMSISAVPVFEDHPNASPAGGPGLYQVVFVLGVPGKTLFHEFFDIPRLLRSGDSLLELPTGAAEVRCSLQLDSGAIDIRFLGNDHNRLARAEMALNATSFAHAEEIAWNRISDMLSAWAFRHDSAVDISGYQIKETLTGAIVANFGIVGDTSILDFNTTWQSTEERRSLLATYREGVNNTNPFYQFLCFFKVIEGVHKIRVQRRKSDLKKGILRRDAEKFPSALEEFPSSLTDHAVRLAGKRFNAVVDEMRATVRNALAHLNPHEDHLIADRFKNVKQCESQIPTVRYIARQMLQAELDR